MIIISIVGAFDTLISREKGKLNWAWNTFLDFYVVNLLVGTVFTLLIRIIKELRMEAGDTLFISKVFFLGRTLACFRVFIINLFKRTFGTVLNRFIEIGIVSRTR